MSKKKRRRNSNGESEEEVAPTEEELTRERIFKQETLPDPKAVEEQNYVDPIRQWVQVDKGASNIPGRRETLF